MCKYNSESQNKVNCVRRGTCFVGLSSWKWFRQSWRDCYTRFAICFLFLFIQFYLCCRCSLHAWQAADHVLHLTDSESVLGPAPGQPQRPHHGVRHQAEEGGGQQLGDDQGHEDREQHHPTHRSRTTAIHSIQLQGIQHSVGMKDREGTLLRVRERERVKGGERDRVEERAWLERGREKM